MKQNHAPNEIAQIQEACTLQSSALWELWIRAHSPERGALGALQFTEPRETGSTGASGCNTARGRPLQTSRHRRSPLLLEGQSTCSNAPSGWTHRGTRSSPIIQVRGHNRPLRTEDIIGATPARIQHPPNSERHTGSVVALNLWTPGKRKKCWSMMGAFG